jgi:hypothetical protein
MANAVLLNQPGTRDGFADKVQADLAETEVQLTESIVTTAKGRKFTLFPGSQRYTPLGMSGIDKATGAIVSIPWTSIDNCLDTPVQFEAPAPDQQSTDESPST